MRNFLLLAAAILALAGCAHKELEAPCGPLSMAADDGCGELKPINVAVIGAMRDGLS